MEFKQSVVASSSGEAEYHGMVKRGCVALGLKLVLEHVVVEANMGCAVKTHGAC